MLLELTPIVGIITGIVAIAGMVYGFGFKFSSLETKVNLIWSVFVEDALRGQLKAGTISHSSPYQITSMRRTQDGAALGELEESGKLSITVQEYLAFICVELKTNKLS